MGSVVDRLRRPQIAAFLILLLLVLLFFWRVLFGGRVLVPGDVLFSSPPWQAFAQEFGVTYPHNELLSDMLLENLVWKNFAKETLAQGDLPLWNPYIFGGMPFLAAGQNAVLYPLGFLFHLLPPVWAYGWFTALHFLLAGFLMYLFLRLIGASQMGGLVAAFSFAFSSFMVVSVIWPMVLGTVIWLPLLLILAELIIRNGEQGVASRSPTTLLLALAGGVVIGVLLLGGHLEYAFYVLFSVLFYAVARLLVYLRQGGSLSGLLTMVAALGAMAVLGFGLAGAQLLPFLELARENFRSGLVTYQDVVSYALPKKQFLGFLMPDFFGNPTHHTYFDFLDWQTKAVTGTTDLSGHPRPYPFWGIKNYVEAAAYVGVLPLLLGLVALVFRRDRYTWTFFAYAAFSLLLAFGTPLYRLFWALPGFEQLHTPFRWLFPCTFSLAVLAGLGVTTLTESGHRFRHGSIVLGAGALLGGLLLIALAAARWLYEPALTLAEHLLSSSQTLAAAFSSPQMLYSYQFRNLLVLGLLLLSGGLVLALGPRTRRGKLALVAIVVADLFFFGYDYNAAASPRLLEFTPPAVRFLQEDQEPFRVVSFGWEDALPPNTAMLKGIQDARGYDSIIPKQYVAFWGLMEEPQGLLYNRIHKLVRQESLTSPFLDLLNVKYVLSTQPLALPGLREVYRGEVEIYRNEDYLPRAFVLSDAIPAASREEALKLMRRASFDPKRTVVLETGEPLPASSSAGGLTPARIISYRANEVVVGVDSLEAGYLVLTDNYFPGWRAAVDGQETRLYRADATFRAVRLPPGPHKVVFRYSPDSFKMGLMASFIAAIGLVVGAGYWFRQRLAGRLTAATTIQRIVKNVSVPLAAQLLNKMMDFAFAIFMLRLLGPLNAGKYAFAVVLIGYFAIFTDFGLGTLLTREVAKAKDQANRYLANTAILRLLLTSFSIPLLLGVLGLYAWRSSLTPDIVWTSLLLMAAIFPSGIASAFSSVFSAHEQMEFPAAVSLVSNLLRMVLGVTVLLLGWGIVGLGTVSFVVSMVTAVIFYRLLTRTFFRPSLEVDTAFQKGMLQTAYPLMINNFLSTIFFRIDVMLLKPMQGDLVNGWYTTAYKFVDGLIIIPSLFTLAIFPILSRYAQAGRESLLRAYTLSLRALLLLGMPLAVGIALLADRIVVLFFGHEYAPSGTALMILIWFLPFSFINSLTQYVLIAVNQQRFLTFAFLLGAAFNILTNLILIPTYSYLGAAFTTILSEIVLLIPFLYAVRKHVGRVSLLAISWRPALASFAMGAILWWLRPLNIAALVIIGVIAYGVALVLLRTFNEEDRALVKGLLGR
jgi:O-antigen/teichoic acid export membrane protein